MSQHHARELAVKLVDVDKTPQASSNPSGDADTQLSPGIRPDVLADAAQRQIRASVRAALFGGETGEAPMLGRYRVLTCLGEGGMGVVYAAYDERLDRKIALKLLRGGWSGREGRERVIREARALARLSHPNVVHVYEVDEADDELYVAMEFLTGPTLRRWMEEKPRRWTEVLAVFRQAAEGLAAAHRQGVIHRDFKPANAILGADGRVRVLDFGLARIADADDAAAPTAVEHLPGAQGPTVLTHTGAVLGTPAYMAPEQFAGRRGDARTDQFSFCSALYEALYGARPFAGDSLVALAAAVSEGKLGPPPAGSEVPAWLHRVVARGLLPDPAARWPSMDALCAALTPNPGRRAWLRSGLALALAGGATALTWQLRPDTSAEVAAQREDAERTLAAATAKADEARLTTARDALLKDPLAAARMLAELESEDPETWRRAGLLAAVARVHGLPARVLRAGTATLMQLAPLPGGRLLGRDELGAVWRWDLGAGTAERVIEAGGAETIVAARDVPVWAALRRGTALIFTADRAEPVVLDLGGRDPFQSTWRLTADGRTLVASPALSATGEPLVLWALDEPAAPPRTITTECSPQPISIAMTDEGSVLALGEARGIRLVDGAKTEILPYEGVVLAFSRSGRYLLTRPAEREGVLDVFDRTTGTWRQVEAAGVLVLSGDDVLFARDQRQSRTVRRESLATGEIVWSLRLSAVQGAARAIASTFVVDAAGGRFAALDEGNTWVVGDLSRGKITTYTVVPEGGSPLWADAELLVHRSGAEVRAARPGEASLQIRHSGPTGALAPAGRFGLVERPRPNPGEFTRVELATGEQAPFRCPRAPAPQILRGREILRIDAAVDDTGQVAMVAPDWNCWWNEHDGAREGRASGVKHLTGLPRGFALATSEDSVEVWSGPETRTHQWTLGERVEALIPNPSGELLAADTASGSTHVMRLATGTATVIEGAPDSGRKDRISGALAWSPDGARLAVLGKNGASLRLGLWDMGGGEAREVARHELADTPGGGSNRMSFTPSGAAIAFTDSDRSVALLELTGGERRRVEVPATPGHIPLRGALFGVLMLDETRAVAVDSNGIPVLVDFAAGEAQALMPHNIDGFSSTPALRRTGDGSVWMCDVLGLGTLVQLAPTLPPGPDVRGWVRGLVE